MPQARKKAARARKKSDEEDQPDQTQSEGQPEAQSQSVEAQTQEPQAEQQSQEESQQPQAESQPSQPSQAESQAEPQAEQDEASSEDQKDEAGDQDDRDPGQYKPRHRPLQNAGFDDKSEEEKRQAELAEERRIHLARTAGQSVDEPQQEGQEEQPQEANV